MAGTVSSPPELSFRAPLDYGEMRRHVEGALCLMPTIGHIEDKDRDIEDGLFMPHSFNILSDCIELQGQIFDVEESNSDRWALVTVTKPQARFYRRVLNGLLGKSEVNIDVHYLPRLEDLAESA
jgi:hypothetical protein